MGLEPHKVFVVSLMPCTAKKAECELPTMKDACGDPDVDVVLTTREMCRLFRSDCIRPASLKSEEFDSPLGTGTGAAVIFGTTGGVMDAALRSAYNLVTGTNPNPDVPEAAGSRSMRVQSTLLTGVTSCGIWTPTLPFASPMKTRRSRRSIRNTSARRWARNPTTCFIPTTTHGRPIQSDCKSHKEGGICRPLLCSFCRISKKSEKSENLC